MRIGFFFLQMILIRPKKLNENKHVFHLCVSSIPAKAAVRVRRVPAAAGVSRPLLPRLAIRALQLLSMRPDEGPRGGALRKRPRPTGTRAQPLPRPPTLHLLP